MRRIWAVYRTFLGVVDGRWRRVGFVLLAGLSIGVAVVVRRTAGADRGISTVIGLVDQLHLRFLVPVVALVYASTLLGEPREDGTLVYVWMRPVSRTLIAVAGFLAAATWVLPLSVASAIGGAAILHASPRQLVAVGVAAGAAALAYMGLFQLLGLVTSRALAWGLGYVLIWDNFIARGGRALAALSIHAHAVSILRALMDRPVLINSRVPRAPFMLLVSGVTCGSVAILSVIVVTWRLRRLEVR